MISITTDGLNVLADYILLTAIPGMAIFIFRYINPRLEHSFIRTMMIFLSSALLMLFLINAASIFLGDYFGRPIIRVIGYSFLSVASWGLLGSLIRVQRENPPVSKVMGMGLRPEEEVNDSLNSSPDASSDD